MKKFFFILFCMVLPVSLFAQKDTIMVLSDAGEGGNLNIAVSNVVNADPTGAQLSNTVFKLEHYGYYILTGPIITPANSHLTLVGPEPGNTQETAPPMILWTTAGGVTTTFSLQCYGDLTMKNIWMLCADVSGAQVGSSILISDDTLAGEGGNKRRLEMDGCIIDYMSIGNGGGAIEPASRHFSAKITNTYFRNLTDPHFPYYGRPMSWTFGSTTWHNDTISFENCTISNVGYAYMQEAGEFTDYLSFNHCTFYNTVMFTLESSYWWNLSVTNCLFVNAYMLGLTTTPTNGTTPNGGAINIDSVATFDYTFPFTDSKGAPVEQQRHILFANNSYGNEQWYINLLNNNPYNPDVDSQKIHRMPMMSGKTLRFFTDSTDGQKNFPYMNMANVLPPVDTTVALPAVYNAATDPQFFLSPANVDSIRGFLYGRWFSSANVNWAYNPEEDTKQVWPMSESFAYSNATLKSAAMGGFPLGDLYHWWPTQYQQWKAQADAERAYISNWLATGTAVNSVKGLPAGNLPSEFSLEQNYPNPFNPMTHIEYTVPKHGYVSLKVYNNLGQEVVTLFSGVQNAGKYVATFDGKGLASGVYLYRLQAENISISKKLVLMK